MRIWQRYVPHIPLTKQFIRIQDSLCQQTIMKSDAQLPRYEDPIDVEPPLHAPPPPVDPSAASSSQSAPPPSNIEEMLTRLMVKMQTFQNQYICLDGKVD